MSAVFITGTGTDVGKTFVCAGLIRYFRGLGQPVAALKPFVSGFDPGHSLLVAIRPCASRRWAAKSRRRNLNASRRGGFARRFPRTWRRGPKIKQSICKRSPISPARRSLRNDGALLIEGIGGIMVPLDARHTVLDLMNLLNLPLILVGGSYLGTLSHVLSA